MHIKPSILLERPVNMPTFSGAPLAYSQQSRASDLENWYSTSEPDTEDYFASSEMSGTQTTSQLTDTTSRSDSVTVAVLQESKNDDARTKRPSIFRFGGYGKKAQAVDQKQDLTKKRTFANFRQSIKQLVGRMRSREEADGEGEGECRVNKAAKTEPQEEVSIPLFSSI